MGADRLPAPKLSAVWADRIAEERSRQERRDRSLVVLAEVADERERQYVKHHDQSHLPDGTGPDVEWGGMGRASSLAMLLRERCQDKSAAGRVTFRDILLEEVAEAFAEADPSKLRAELVQVVAVGVQWIEAIDRRIA